MTTRLSRRDFLKATAGAGGAVVAAATNIGSIPVLGQDDYQGKIVFMSAGEASQHENVIAGIEGAFPGIEIEWRSLTSERYTELFAAAEIAGDQIDIMDLNGQDLRRYAVGGRLKDLSNVDYLDRFRPIGLETYTIGGKLWAIPNGGISGFAFFVQQEGDGCYRFRGRSGELSGTAGYGGRSQGCRLCAFHTFRAEHLSVAGVAILGLCADFWQQASRGHLGCLGRQYQVYRRRAFGRFGNLAGLHRRRYVR